MKKKFLGLLTAVAVAAAVMIPAVSHVAAAGNFSDWKCSQCGATRHMAGQHPPSAQGCKVATDGKHIWFKN